MQGIGGRAIAGWLRGGALAACEGRQQLGGSRRPRGRPELGGRQACWRRLPGARREAVSWIRAAGASEGEGTASETCE